MRASWVLWVLRIVLAVALVAETWAFFAGWDAVVYLAGFLALGMAAVGHAVTGPRRTGGQ
jgi:uncharacterized membrane protein YphA (DoxX/SURF4 family)